MTWSVNRRTMAAALVAVLYAATLMVFGSLSGWSGATTVDVANEEQYRQAVSDLSGDGSGPHTINIVADFTITDPVSEGHPTYTGTQDLTIDGNGHTVDYSGPGGIRFLFHSSDGDLLIQNLTVVGFESGSTGGAVRSTGSVTVLASTFTGNDSGDDQGGALAANGDITAIGSTFNANFGDSGGALFGFSDVVVINSTFNGNSAVVRGGAIEAGDVDLTYATLAGNSAPSGANIFLGSLSSFGSVVADPQGGGTNCATANGLVGTTQYSYDDDGSCPFFDATDTSDGDDPHLGPLSDNDGPTQTMLPLSGSPLIDDIPEADCHDEVTTDQRGVDRPQDGDGDGTLGCDIGAVEVLGADEAAPPARPVEGDPTFTG